MMDSYGDGGDGVLSLNGIVVINGMSNPSSLVSETACVDLTSCNTVTFSNSEYYSNESSWSVSLGADVLASGSGYYSGGAEDDALLGDCGLGCTDPAAENCDPSAVTDDNSCTYTCYDSSVVLTLFDSANDGGGSVTINEVNYELPAGYGNSQISFNICLDLDQCNAVDYVDTDIYWDESSWNITLDEVVIAEAVYSTGFGSLSGSVGNCVLGCLDQTAANYTPDATVSSGACSYTCVENESTFTLTMYDSWGDGWTGNEVIIASASNTNSFTLTEDPNDASSGFFETVSVCMDLNQCTSVYMGDQEFGLGEVSWEITDESGATVAAADYSIDGGSSITDTASVGSCVILGCTDSSYLEYDAEANTDDESCVTLIVEGCTDNDYVEYNPDANVDDGSCVTVAPCELDVVTLTLIDSYGDTLEWWLHYNKR